MFFEEKMCWNGSLDDLNAKKISYAPLFGKMWPIFKIWPKSPFLAKIAYFPTNLLVKIENWITFFLSGQFYDFFVLKRA